MVAAFFYPAGNHVQNRIKQKLGSCLVWVAI
ncbi:Uncharacterised protein [Streptococcus criceti]|nr:Uncharacterised protein [Streptococcus criceti]